jgi:type IV pilus assembly protein PilP
VRISALVMSVALLLVVGCSEQAPGPKTSDFEQEREALMARLEKKKERREGAKTANAPKPRKKGEDEESATPFGKMDKRFSYNRTGKRDPFRSFEWERPDRREEDELRGPLERFDISQLSVVAVVWNTGNARALIKDPSGQSYIVGEGARIGKNEGRVIGIDDNLVVVKETYVDYLGQETTKDIEMRIRGSQGG